MFVAVFLLLATVTTGLAFKGYQSYNTVYHTDVGLAQAGLQHMRNAQTLLESLPRQAFNPKLVSQARQEFSSAQSIFARLDQQLHSLPSVSTLVPIYGARLRAAMHLVPFASAIAGAGIGGCDAIALLLATFHNPLTMAGQGLTMANFVRIAQNFQSIKQGLDNALSEANQVSVSDLQFDPHIAHTFALFQQQAPTIHLWLASIAEILPVLPTLLGIGTPANYFIEVLDATELRPSGGFIGNYGIVSFAGGKLIGTHLTDVSLIDSSFRFTGGKIPYPSAYSWFPRYLASEGWSLRDSNLDADFPTAAKYAEQNYTREGGNIALQGVIAVTPTFVQHVLEITGPIAVPEYNETVTAQNLIARIHYHQLGQAGEGSGFVASPDGHSSLRKRFTELLSEHLLAQIKHFAPSALSRFGPLMLDSLRSKDVQLYLNTKTAEDMLQRFHVDNTVQAPAGDSFLRVDANVSPNKANSFIVNTIDDQVTLDTAGNATHRVNVTSAWTLAGQNYGRALYRDYVRLYVPPGSMLQSQTGWQSQGVSAAFGREVWAGFFTLSYGQSRTITLTWTVPRAATMDSTGWHYHYLVQRQAGVLWMMHTQVTLPACATISNASGGLVTKGKQSVMVTTPLNEDMHFGVNYIC